MEWLDGLTYNKKLKTSFIIYMLIFLILGASFTIIAKVLIETYTSYVEKLYVIEEIVKEGNETITYFRLNPNGPTEFQKNIIEVLGLYKELALLINIFIFSIFGFSLYYKDKIKRPIDELQFKSLEIKDEDSIEDEEYKDEMLMISNSYIQMMDSLKVEKERIWKELNEMEEMMASFEHDVRTPITVIRGYSDMILEYFPIGKMSEAKLENILRNIGLQVNRLDDYIKRRSNLKSVRDVELHINTIEIEKFLKDIERIGEVLSKEKQFKFKASLQSKELNLDENLIIEVYENILTNGFRFARNIVEVKIEEDKEYLIIQVQDNGGGFSKEGLKYGTTAFYSESKLNGENMGLGLYISRKLCEKHRGEINLSNNTVGGLVEMKFKKFYM